MSEYSVTGDGGGPGVGGYRVTGGGGGPGVDGYRVTGVVEVQGWVGIGLQGWWRSRGGWV